MSQYFLTLYKLFFYTYLAVHIVFWDPVLRFLF